ncbi:RING-box protein 2-like [Varroa jacobsoni]|uniref:RING-box protein 2-like n=1 Tax=Varroa jacobsoni TaxID=62625 RepID=UPI000BF3FBED|nr:RING-box protein 2-like [Varroa jacobsoni]
MSGHNPTSPVMRPADEDDVLDTSEVPKADKMFVLKRWNAVAMWSWDVECDVCAICRIQVMDVCLNCSSEKKNNDQDACAIVWGECNHSFHNCCMSNWVTQNPRCPLCQKDWVVQRIGR